MAEREIPGSNVPPTAGEWAVFSELRLFHVGGENPLPMASIERRTGMKAREVKAAVEGLRKRHGVPVGASRNNRRGGYYLAQPRDLARAWKPYFGQAVEMMRTVHVLSGRNERVLAELLGQMRLAILGEANGR